LLDLRHLLTSSGLRRSGQRQRPDQQTSPQHVLSIYNLRVGYKYHRRSVNPPGGRAPTAAGRG
jgi:hypothetical protein